MYRKTKWLFMAGLLFFASSCYYDKEELLYPSNCASSPKSFATDVFPLIQSKCATTSECHASGTTNSGGPLLNYDQIKSQASNIRIQVSHGFMPKTGSLTAKELIAITCWVDAGAPKN